MKITKPASFPEIWEQLDEVERKQIICAVIGTGATIHQLTVKNWAMGKTKPPMPLMRTAIAEAVSKVLGIEISSIVLFG